MAIAHRQNYANNLANGTGIAATNARWTSNQRTGVNELGQPLRNMHIVNFVSAVSDGLLLQDDPDLFAETRLYLDPDSGNTFIETRGWNIAAWLLHCDSEPGRSHGKALTFKLTRIPGVTIERVAPVAPRVRIVNDELIRVKHSYTFDAFLNIDFLRKLKQVQLKNDCASVANKINQLVAGGTAVDDLPDVLGKSILAL